MGPVPRWIKVIKNFFLNTTGKLLSKDTFITSVLRSFAMQAAAIRTLLQPLLGFLFAETNEAYLWRHAEAVRFCLQHFANKINSD